MINDNPDAAWTSGLSRSYSEHAARILEYYQSSHCCPDVPRCTQSGPDCHRGIAKSNNEDDEDPDNGRKTWRISAATPVQRYCKIVDLGSGDSAATPPTSELAQLDLDTISSTTSRNTTTTSSTEGFNTTVERLQLDEDQFRLSDKEKSTGASISSCSLNSTIGRRQRLNGVPLLRQIPYEDWYRDKQRERQRRREDKRRAEQRRREAEEREQRRREEKERREYECFVHWEERKRREQQMKRELVEKELELQKRIQDIEDQTRVAKDICFRQWTRRKTEEQKAAEKREATRQKKLEEERKAEKERRLRESLKAYEKWQEKAKKIPRPATQGLLPHQKAKPAFTNPRPWQPLIDTGSDESDREYQAPKAVKA